MTLSSEFYTPDSIVHVRVTKCTRAVPIIRFTRDDSIHKTLGFHKIAILVGCRSDECPECSEEKLKRRGRKWAFRLNALLCERLRDGADTGFATLTFPPFFAEDGAIRLPTFCEGRRAVQLFVKRLRKAGKRFKYWCTWEYGSKGTQRLHCHMFYMPKVGSWTPELAVYLMRQWHSVLQEFDCDEPSEKAWNSQLIESAAKASSYLTKYVGKGIVCPRIMCSRGFEWNPYLIDGISMSLIYLKEVKSVGTS